MIPVGCHCLFWNLLCILQTALGWVQLLLESDIPFPCPGKSQHLGRGERGGSGGLGSFARLHLSNETFITALQKNVLCKPSELQSNLMDHGEVAGVLRSLGEKSGEGARPQHPTANPKDQGSLLPPMRSGRDTPQGVCAETVP